ncbi:hypothetical protein [Promicromonospora aerolata]|uniref:Uncharacterized protein n=1 Tax=Promicromonospora aerolata TaxID=195749 RepID=A0ABW4V565_9MICO
MHAQTAYYIGRAQVAEIARRAEVIGAQERALREQPERHTNKRVKRLRLI